MWFVILMLDPYPRFPRSIGPILFLKHILERRVFLSLGRRARLLVTVAWIISAIFSVPIVILYRETPIQGKKCSLILVSCWFSHPTPGHSRDGCRCAKLSGSFSIKLKTDLAAITSFSN
jgi:hypothetical protein